jgi:hypothetical protein
MITELKFKLSPPLAYSLTLAICDAFPRKELFAIAKELGASCDAIKFQTASNIVEKMLDKDVSITIIVRAAHVPKRK